jgi:hypothetical protein
VTSRLKRSSSEPLAKAPSQQEGGDTAKDEQKRPMAIAELGTGELPLTRRERILLVAGLNIASALIAFIDRASASHHPGKTSRSTITDRDWRPAGNRQEPVSYSLACSRLEHRINSAPDRPACSGRETEASAVRNRTPGQSTRAEEISAGTDMAKGSPGSGGM